MKNNYSPGTWRAPRSRHTLLIAMARDAEKLAAQGDRIRELRAFARVSQETAAGAVGVTLRGYQRWERGEGEINSDNIRKLAKYFSTTPDYIEYGTMKRERGDAPGLFAPDEPTNAELADMISRLENQIRLLRADLQIRSAEEAQRIAPAAPANRPARLQQQR